jgi:hypothetical protein
MDYRRIYADLTGDYRTPYIVDESDVERYKYSDATMKRAVEELQGAATEGQYDYSRSMMEQHGPRAGVPAGRFYPQTAEAGEEYFFNELLEPYSKGEYGELTSNVMRSFLLPQGQKVGIMQGVFDYFQEKPVREEQRRFERGLLD